MSLADMNGRPGSTFPAPAGTPNRSTSVPILACVLALGVALTTGTARGAQGDPSSRSTMAGVYSTAQAARGEQTYMNICVSCHPPATYTGTTFKNGWGGRPLSDLFTAVTEKMPKNDPGSLTPDEYADVLAFLLKINGIPAGKDPLAPDADALKQIRIETPESQADKH
jgi:mono/diheme cytochrome c family protein